ncbi:MAG TPA: DUF6502 family protein [Rhodopila sp.]
MSEFQCARSLPPVSLLQAARRLLRPLVRVMMRSGLTFPVLADTLRTLFVEVAINDILIDPKSRTDSRISLLTGVHRKEIRRLRAGPADDAAGAPVVLTLVSQIIARWAGTAAFTDADGCPRRLPRRTPGAARAELSFDALVVSVTTDVRPRAVLDDLLGHGIVSIDADDRVRLNTEAFIPRPGGEQQLFFGRSLREHLLDSVENIGGSGTPGLLDRSVHQDCLKNTLGQPHLRRRSDAVPPIPAARTSKDFRPGPGA